MRLGPILRRWRRTEERELRAVAEEIGISSSTLGRLESGQTPHGDTLAAVIRWLLTDGPGAPAPGAPAEGASLTKLDPDGDGS